MLFVCLPFFVFYYIPPSEYTLIHAVQHLSHFRRSLFFFSFFPCHNTHALWYTSIENKKKRKALSRASLGLSCFYSLSFDRIWARVIACTRMTVLMPGCGCVCGCRSMHLQAVLLQSFSLFLRPFVHFFFRLVVVVGLCLTSSPHASRFLVVCLFSILCEYVAELVTGTSLAQMPLRRIASLTRLFATLPQRGM